MYTWQQWCQHVQQMHAYIQAQSGKIAELEKAMEGLKAEIGTLKEQKRVHIDKIEYKFDQLKVETLEGTLNIGITPSAVEDMAVSSTGGSSSKEGLNETDEAEKIPSESTQVNLTQGLSEDIQRNLQQFMDKQVPVKLEALQEQYGTTLDDWHQKMIINDLEKQIEPRIAYYLRQMEQGATKDQLSSIKDSVIFRTKNDIQSALNSYFSKMPKKEVKE